MDRNGNSTSMISPFLRRPSSDEHAVIPGPSEAAAGEHWKGLELRVTNEAYKADFRKICAGTLKNHVDLRVFPYRVPE